MCLQSGGAAPPPTPPALKPNHACNKNSSIMSSSCLLLGKVARILVFANGGDLSPPFAYECSRAEGLVKLGMPT